MNCPLCDSLMVVVHGTCFDPADGYPTFCSNRECPAQEVAGHGHTQKEAEEVVRWKFKDTGIDKQKEPEV